MLFKLNLPNYNAYRPFLLVYFFFIEMNWKTIEWDTIILATTMGFNVDVQRDKNQDFLKSIEA